MSTEDYRKPVVNKLCHIVLLPEAHARFKVEGKVAKTNRQPDSHLQQLTRSMFVRTLTCAKLSSETGIVLSTIRKPAHNDTTQYDRGIPVAMCRPHQTASESLSTGRWSLSPPYPHSRRDTDPFIWTWAKQAVGWMVPPRITTPTKKIDKTRLGETRYGFRLRQYSAGKSCPSWHHSKKLFAAQISCNMLFYHTTPSDITFPEVRTWLVTWQCSLSRCQQSDLFWRRNWEVLEFPPYSLDTSPFDNFFQKVKDPLHGIHFRIRNDTMKAAERVKTDTPIRNAADGVRHLPYVWQHVCSVAGDYTLGLYRQSFKKWIQLIFEKCCHLFSSGHCKRPCT